MSFFGLESQQAPQATNMLAALLDDVNPTAIVEFGTGDGGLSVLIGIWAYLNNASFATWDNQRPRKDGVNELLRNLRVETRNADYLAASEMEYVRRLFRKNFGRCMVICDGGNKAKEMSTFGAMLHPGDVIMGHDYAPSLEAFKARYKDRIWRTWELGDETTKELRKIGFEVYAPELAASAWLCMRKR